MYTSRTIQGRAPLVVLYGPDQENHRTVDSVLPVIDFSKSKLVIMCVKSKTFSAMLKSLFFIVYSLSKPENIYV